MTHKRRNPERPAPSFGFDLARPGDDKTAVFILHPSQVESLRRSDLPLAERVDGEVPLIQGEAGMLLPAIRIVPDIRGERTMERVYARRLLEIRQDAQLHAARYWNHIDNRHRWPAVPAPLPMFDPDEMAVLQDRALVRLLDARADATLRHRTDGAPRQFMVLLALLAVREATRITTCRAPFAHNRVIHLWRTRYMNTSSLQE